ncbi:phosphoadenylylsulfate reductase (thioredoxin) [Rhodobacter sp. JA431]|uniref:phosphoadenylyl-sulfate reductase n=1 Tax=Rhodobacter sp. JA431 TaxID=570013 RepID=UPI000BC6AE63|nr:phosphoadenylyl-sulfate reductase [Rhodobacter sp. JA431]SOC04773.1 phosphoadenylylsulfate reductase (thioredoxin) [Rhodobacter sp. JA431]
MRLELSQRVAGLNHRYRSHDPAALVAATLNDPDTGRVALVSSFGAESVVLLHMVATRAPETPVLFVDTLMLFEETLAYQREVAETLGLKDLRVIRASEADLAAQDPENKLHKTDTDACCALRKTAPLEAALAEFDGWMTGRKRYQGQTRADIDHFEVETPTRMKINPLAHWGRTEIADYMDRYDLPRHPLVARGYPSIGCAPCTSPVAAGEDPRAGRWRGQEKTECGIHFVNGRIVRPGSLEAEKSEKVA